uniref:Uncharacterized protein n=1 Tax=Rhizophora mucronata TaxID=61149 RepID=A0A2P2PXU9_RHIMU
MEAKICVCVCVDLFGCW